MIYLSGIVYKDLIHLLNFMYQGEVIIVEDDIQSFLCVAKDLKLKGLYDQKLDVEILDSPMDSNQYLNSTIATDWGTFFDANKVVTESLNENIQASETNNDIVNENIPAYKKNNEITNQNILAYKRNKEIVNK